MSLKAGKIFTTI